ncbi:hypothetical protein GW17_00032380 [Ensete ventricosum]|nr:hypothetical protein GW17_00032380 [Ensete ventricosum]
MSTVQYSEDRKHPFRLVPYALRKIDHHECGHQGLGACFLTNGNRHSGSSEGEMESPVNPVRAEVIGERSI